MSRYSLAGHARLDIDGILVFIAADNVDAAVSFNDRLTDTLSMLGDNPKAGRDRSELNEGLRSFPFGNYVIFYRIWADRVTITRVLHSARDLDELFR
ncbi:MAG: type II toxin-antitoxin system RelE/ParE family toxin [Acidobacteria bacterium]|nr:type II toxin-antitoxin system RelE/ParE family toxin [Acidobacteriota bacterium]